MLRREVCAQQSRDVHLWVKYPEMNVKSTCFQNDPGTDDLLTLVRLLARSAARDCLVTSPPLITPVDRSEDREPFTSPNDEG